MEAANMTYAEEVIKLRTECKELRIKNTNHEKKNDRLTKKVALVEQESRELRLQNHLLKQKQQLLIEKQNHLEKTIESLKLIVEELRRMIFGKKKHKKDTADSGSSEEKIESNSGESKKRKSAQRTPASYRRAAPREEEVTDTYEHPLTNCPDCGTLLTDFKTLIRYVEDLEDLAMLSKLLKKIEKHVIGSGYCSRCKKRKVAQIPSKQVSILGEEVKKFVCYLSIVMRLSFEQIRCFLQDTASFAISDGEITNSLSEQAETLIPEKDRLLQKIRGAPGRHYDETGWKVQHGGQGNYCWITRPTEGEETVFLMGRSRGKGNAKELQGAVDNQVGISDDYAAYDNLFEKHQLCMAHPHRKLRDLAEAKTISEEARDYCTKTYHAFATLYAALKKTLGTEYQKDLWLQKREEYITQLKTIAIPIKEDPQKLKAIKHSLEQNAEKYFTCLREPGIPADNNKAERGLRHVVLKRKISYGSKSQKGADTMAVLCSTLLSCWWNKPQNFFVAYNQMLTS